MSSSTFCRRTKNFSRASAASRSRAAIRTIRWRSRCTTPTSASATRPWPSTCVSRSATGIPSAMPATIRSARAPAAFRGKRARRMASGRGQGRCRVRILHQAGRAVLVLPRHRPGAGCRRHRRVREEPEAHGRPGQGAPGRHRHEAAVGHGQPVLAPALHEWRFDQSGFRRGRARGGAGQGGAGGHRRTGRRALRVLGRPRRLCLAGQHADEARGRPLRPLPDHGPRLRPQHRA